MKKLKYIFLLALSSIIISCDNDDEGFYNAVYIKATENLIHIEHQNTYLIGDYIWLGTENFNRLITEPNQTTPLDIFQTTKATAFEFIYGLEKKEGNTWNLITVGNNLLIDKGSAQTGSYVLAKCIYNEATSNYEYRGGIKLAVSGEYRMFFGKSFTSDKNFDITSVNTDPAATYLTISTSTNNLSTDGYYYFSVN